MHPPETRSTKSALRNEITLYTIRMVMRWVTVMECICSRQLSVRDISDANDA